MTRAWSDWIGVDAIMTDEREWIISRPVESACRIPPSTGPRTLSMRWSKLDLSSKRVQITASAVIVFFFLMPLLLGIYFIYINPPRGIVELNAGEDTFVSSSYEQEYSNEHFLRVSNYSQGSEVISEVGFFEFFYVPPPGGGDLVDALFSFHCSFVSIGEIGLHIIDSGVLWDPFETDLYNLTYSSIPPYEPVPFTTLTVNSNGTYSVRIFGPGGLTQETRYGIVGFAITAKQDTRIVIDSFEGAVENRPKLTMFVRAGLIVQNPFVYYLHPLFTIPVLAGIVLILIVIRRSTMQSRQQESIEPKKENGL